MKPVNFAIIGCGVIGTVHLRSAQQSKNVRVVAIADLRAELVREAAKAHQV